MQRLSITTPAQLSASWENIMCQRSWAVHWQAEYHLYCGAGNLARMFTTLVLTKDALLLLANAVQGCLNSVLLYQTAMTAVRRRAVRRQKALDTAELYHEPGDDQEVRPHALPVLFVSLSGCQVYILAAHRVEPAGPGNRKAGRARRAKRRR